MKKSDLSLYDCGGNSLTSHFTLLEGLDGKTDFTRVDANVGGAVSKVNVSNRHLVAAEGFSEPP
jgi:hypothetical protein